MPVAIFLRQPKTPPFPPLTLKGPFVLFSALLAAYLVAFLVS